MKHRTLLLIILAISLSQNSIFAEGKKDFKLVVPKEKTSNSLYNKLKLLDSRIDTTNFGFVQTGMFNNRAKVIVKEALSNRLKHLFQNMIDSTAQNGEMLFQLRGLAFAEVSGTFSEKGLCSFWAILYERGNDKYRKIAEIDTVITVKRMDVTGAILKAGGKAVYEFIKDNLQNKASDTIAYSYKQVQTIDFIEKQRLKLFTADTLKDGVYYTYQSFRDQTPDDSIIVKYKEGKVSSVKIRVLKKGKIKEKKLKSKNVYAIVDNGKPYISSDFGYYSLIKSNDDFYFQGKMKKTANSRDVFVAQFMFGIAGGIIASNSATGKYQMTINYKNGNPIRLKRLD